MLEVPSPDEVESYLVLQKCLELRKSYVFTEEVAPWDKEVISDPSTPKPNPNPFFYTPEGKTDVSLYLFFLCNSFGLQSGNHQIYFCLITHSIVLLQHYFEMEDGVVHVYANKDCKL